jgi:hypothetical protein
MLYSATRTSQLQDEYFHPILRNVSLYSNKFTYITTDSYFGLNPINMTYLVESIRKAIETFDFKEVQGFEELPIAYKTPKDIIILGFLRDISRITEEPSLPLLTLLPFVLSPTYRPTP